MTAREFAASLRSAWQAYTALGAVGLSLLAFAKLPGQVADHEARISSLEESRRFQNCWLLETAAERDPNPCRYLLSNPEEFRPPFNGGAP